MSEYKGEGGTIYVERSKDNADDRPYEVWYEDFCILGLGDSEPEALKDAAKHTTDIQQLISDAIVENELSAAASGG